MKIRLFFILLFICYVSGVNAQELVVSSFRLDPLDASATGNDAILDGEGKPCALIKVRFAAAPPTFEGNVMPDVKEKHKNEYWVYVLAHSLSLTIRHELAPPVDVNFSDYNISELQSSCTYILDLKLIQSEKNYWVDSNTKILGKWARDNVSTATSQELDRENVMFEFKKEGVLKYTYVHQIEDRTFKAKYKVTMNGLYSIAKDSVFILFETFDYDDGISVKRKDGYVVTKEDVYYAKDQMSKEFRYLEHGLYRKVRLILLDKREMIFEMGNNEITSERKQEKYIRK